MQPYFFPYLGYFHLLQASDLFVFLDDVQHIRRGWVNRNRIQQGGSTFFFTVPLAKSPRNSLINQQIVSRMEYPFFVQRFQNQLQAAYSKTQFYKEVFPLVVEILQGGGQNMARLAERSVKGVLEYLGVDKRILIASQLPDEARGLGLTAQERIIHIAKKLGARIYLNLPGGKGLYQPESFAEAGLELLFVVPQLSPYARKGPWVQGLSVIDPLMNLGPKDVLKLFSRYTLRVV